MPTTTTTRPANWFLPTERVVTPVPVAPQPALPVSVLMPWKKDGVGERRMTEQAFRGGHRTFRFTSYMHSKTIRILFQRMYLILADTMGDLQKKGTDLKLQGRIAVRFIKRNLAAEHRHLVETGEAPPPLKEDIAWIAHDVWEVPR